MGGGRLLAAAKGIGSFVGTVRGRGAHARGRPRAGRQEGAARGRRRAARGSAAARSGARGRAAQRPPEARRDAKAGASILHGGTADQGFPGDGQYRGIRYSARGMDGARGCPLAGSARVPTQQACQGPPPPPAAAGGGAHAPTQGCQMGGLAGAGLALGKMQQ
ncbi:MAG: hypothetical protein J3K34DRAFT_413296 [Monoraphidium minutum]|nr:MAG: hypothetical protein J3K34DRAFT_413296 [Monoraphidium minutum]